MKYLSVIFVFFFSVTSLFSQEFISNSTVHFKDSTVVSGDVYYNTGLTQSITVIDNHGEKHIYNLALIKYIQGKSNRYRVFDCNNRQQLFEAIIEGIKVSLYKTVLNDTLQYFILKNDKLTLLEGGEIEYVIDGTKYKKENEHYKETLKLLLYDNKYVVNKLNRISYDERKIAPLIIAYNNGYIAFIKPNDTVTQNKIPNWKIYTQFSRGFHITNFMRDQETASLFMQTGAECYISEESRHSFKLGLEYGQIDGHKRPEGNWISITSGYYYDFYRKPGGNVYVGVNLLDIGVNWGSDNKGIFGYPNLSPLLGYKDHISKKLDMFFELNHLFLVTTLPFKFSFGLSYDL